MNSKNNAFFLEVIPVYPVAEITIYGREEEPPTLEKYDFSHILEVNSTKQGYFLGNGTIKNLEYYVGVKAKVQTNYKFKSHYYDEGNKSWTSQGCTVR